jgi:carbohydrate kinase (thermoresistant glucokinase family)
MIVVVMGVSGVGKTTVGTALARELGWHFIDADGYHPPANVAKMAAGIALDDADRWPWLETLNRAARKEKDAVLACSALKEVYRSRITEGLGRFEIVYLHGSFELIRARLVERPHHYMPASLLASQFATLEPPVRAISVDVVHPAQDCVRTIMQALQDHTPNR